MRTRTPDPPHMLTEGNTHLGRDLWTFSLPAFCTCPGATFACLAARYALRFRFTRDATLRLHRANWERALDARRFARAMALELRFRRVRVLRIHVAGDFFSAAYIRAWARVARALPRVSFLFYTRSWTRPEMVRPLIELAALDNVLAWWSEDRATGPCRLPVGRRCFLCADEADEGLVPSGVDLVFRDRARRPRKWVGSAWVCPKEQGVERTVPVTCSTCRRCFLAGPMPRPVRSRHPEAPAPGVLPAPTRRHPWRRPR